MYFVVSRVGSKNRPSKRGLSTTSRVRTQEEDDEQR